MPTPIRRALLLAALLSLPPAVFAAAATGKPGVVERMPGLVAFWTFGEEPGLPRRSSATRNPHPLVEVGALSRASRAGRFPATPPS